MELEQDTLVEIGVSLLGVGLFIVGVVVIGMLFADGGLAGQGAQALIGLMVLFIIVMTLAGYWLSGREE